MQMKKTIGNEGVKHNIKFEEQNNRIIKGVKWNFLLERSPGSLSLFNFGLFSLINNISSNVY